MCPSTGYLEQQDAAADQPITPQMLMIVSSWLSEVSFEFSMQQETLFLAVGLLSRFLDSSSVSGNTQHSVHDSCSKAPAVPDPAMQSKQGQGAVEVSAGPAPASPTNTAAQKSPLCLSMHDPDDAGATN